MRHAALFRALHKRPDTGDNWRTAMALGSVRRGVTAARSVRNPNATHQDGGFSKVIAVLTAPKGTVSSFHSPAKTANTFPCISSYSNWRLHERARRPVAGFENLNLSL